MNQELLSHKRICFQTKSQSPNHGIVIVNISQNIKHKDMSLIKYNGRNWANDDLADWFLSWPFGRTTTYSYKGQWVDTDKFDVIPKQSYKNELIEEKKKKLEVLDEQINKLRAEIKELKKDS